MSLALQGGGAHGAFTWGVLDRLLEADRYEFPAVTGTSAGAVNAIALAHGLLVGGADGARDTLDAVWQAVGSQAPTEFMMTGSTDRPTLTLLAKTALSMSMSMSPAQLNPLGVDPLRDILTTHIDFERLRTDPAAPRVHLAATHADSGRLRIFSNAELSVRSVLASACLPTLSKPVEIEGEPYWDGGFSANPPLQPFVADGRSDVLLVLIVPTRHEGVPERTAGIRARQQELAFTTAFLRETEMVAAATARAQASRWPFLGDLEKTLRRMRWHLIDAGPHLGMLDPQTRAIPHLPFLKSLRDTGREFTQDWLIRHGRSVGQRATADLATLSSLAG